MQLLGVEQVGGLKQALLDSQSTLVIPVWTPGTTYTVNQLVVNAGDSWLCTATHVAPDTFAETNWKKLGSASEVTFPTAVTKLSIAGNHLTAAMSDGTKVDIGAVVSVPSGGTQGQVLVKKSGSDYDVTWQNNAGVQGTFGGEFSTKADLLAYTDPIVGYSYVVKNDEEHDGIRTYYTLLQGKVWQYMGSFSDDSSVVQGSSYFTRQWNSSGDVVANDTKVLTIPYTDTFTIIAPEVWFYETGETNIVKTVSEFDSGSAAAFSYDPRYVEFVGTGTGTGSQMRLKTSYSFPFTKDETWTGDGQYSECSIDLTQFKTVESITVV